MRRQQGVSKNNLDGVLTVQDRQVMGSAESYEEKKFVMRWLRVG
jgi:hypothetical protein